MATTLVQVFNLALSACGSDGLVMDPNERTREANLCRLWIEPVRKQVIASAPWPSVITSERLVRHHSRSSNDQWGSTDPYPGHLYAYAVPQEMLAPWYTFSYQPFLWQGGYINTSDEAPILVYLRDEPVPQFWDSALENAIVHYLAARIARPLTGDAQIVSEQFQIASLAAEAARVQAAEMLPQTPTESLPDWITERGYTTAGTLRFFYPFQYLNPVTA